MIEFAQSRQDVDPEIKAWLYVDNAPVASWEQALAACHQLEKFRPLDFRPALMMAIRVAAGEVDPPAPEQWNGLIEIIRRAIPPATDVEEATDCLAMLGTAALQPKKTGNNPEVVFRVWEFIRAVEVPNIHTDPANALRLNLVRLNLAIAVKDFSAAIQVARLCGMRSFEPLYLIMARRYDEACRAVEKLRQDASLRDVERGALLKIEPLVLMFAHKFHEARDAMSALRQTRTLTPEDSKWLGTMENLLENFEKASEDRIKQRSC
jgi:hypothetical protein